MKITLFLTTIVILTMSLAAVATPPWLGSTIVECEIHVGGYLGEAMARPNESYSVACFNQFRTGADTYTATHKIAHNVSPSDPISNIKVYDLTLPHCFSGIRKEPENITL
ncbi:MAG: hypothetical protein L3J53_07880 [Proteobacteria bacterium]|nr:hypothetical protein [Pseudomonadota bacterium]